MGNDAAEVVAMIDDLIRDMSLDEKCVMLSGEGPWVVPGCQRLGVPNWRTSDGPVGVRGGAVGTGLLLPNATALASTWDPDLVEALGAALGDEARPRHVDLLLAPTVNLHRSPLAGRHFECFSEDPELTAAMAVAYVRGVQTRGVAACIKHFIGNEQETERLTIDTIIDDTTLREVYLRPFEDAVALADVRSVMAAYNYVNGHHCTAQPGLLVDVLRGEWGFDGVVVSDWGAVKETVAPALHGLDLEMPGPGRWWGDGRLVAAVERGDVSESLVDDKVRRVLRLLAWRGRLPGESVTADEVMEEQPGHRALVRGAAADAMVLVRNDGVLPLEPGATVALIGPGAEHTALLGGGSAALLPYRSTSVLDSMNERWGSAVTHAMGVDLRRGAPPVPADWLVEGVTVEFFAGSEPHGEPVAVERCESTSNVWFGDGMPAAPPVATRATFTVVPDVGGPARLFVSAFGRCRLAIDGEQVLDNETRPFSAGLGRTAGEREIQLESGRRYEFVFEVRASESGFPVLMFDIGISPLADPDVLLDEAVALAAAADVAVVVVGSSAEWESEGVDRESLRLPRDQDELVRRVAGANPDTVVVLNSGAPMEMPWFDDVAATLIAWYPGQEGGEAIVDVLTGEVDPGGRMPTTWPRRLEDTPSFDSFPGERGVVSYDEGLLVGHRWYDAHGIDPLLPFGHGLSYATFEWGAPTVSHGDDAGDLVVEVPITNVGQRSGSEVVQVYLTRPDAGGERPLRTLAGFAKVTVSAGDTSVARVEIPQRRFARWGGSGWIVDPGEYRLSVAASATDLRGTVVHVVAAGAS